MAVSTSECCPEPRGHDTLDPAEFAQDVRQLAIDAHRSLTRPDTRVDELIDLKSRVENLSREIHGSEQRGSMAGSAEHIGQSLPGCIASPYGFASTAANHRHDGRPFAILRQYRN